METYDEAARRAMLLAWRQRREANKDKPQTDNGALPAGSPMYFRCPACFGDIILAEGYLSKPALCYDCLYLSRLDLIRVTDGLEYVASASWPRIEMELLDGRIIDLSGLTPSEVAARLSAEHVTPADVEATRLYIAAKDGY